MLKDVKIREWLFAYFFVFLAIAAFAILIAAGLANSGALNTGSYNEYILVGAKVSVIFIIISTILYLANREVKKDTPLK